MRRAATPAAALAALLAAALAASACRDRTLSECLEPDAQFYGFRHPSDTSFLFRWPDARMPLLVYAEPAGGLPEVADSAMALWAHAMRCGELSFVRTTDSGAADIMVMNPPALPAPAAVTAAADSVGACSGQTGIDTAQGFVVTPLRVDVAPNSSVADTAAVAGCYRFTVAHELGHALGLLRHSTNPDDLMFASPWRRLATVNDRYTVQVLYHTAPRILPEP